VQLLATGGRRGERARFMKVKVVVSNVGEYGNIHVNVVDAALHDADT
jgi:hypothetical protein